VSEVQVLRAQAPSEAQVKSIGQVAAVAQAVAAQWWSRPQLWPVRQSASALQPGWHAAVTPPQAQEIGAQIDGPGPASMATQSESAVQGDDGIMQTPPQTCWPGAAQIPYPQSEATQHGPPIPPAPP
jgi:hypothetical protein